MKKVTALLLVSILMLASCASPQESRAYSPVDFPDRGLEAAVRAEIGRPQGPIYYGDVESITRLDASGRNIRRLDGIHQLSKLEELILRDNLISDLEPLIGNKLLSILDLRNNYVADIGPLAGLDRLQQLDLRDNLVADVSPLTELTSLIELNLRGNRISDITPLSRLVLLQQLNLRENNVEDIESLAEMVQLRDLNLRYNRVKDIDPLAELERLTVRLLLEGNPIRDYRPVRSYYADIEDKDFQLEVTDPEFSILGGYFDRGFDLELTTAQPAAEIYYTLDGSEPNPGRPGTFRYQQPLAIVDRSSEPNIISVIRTTHHDWPGPPQERVFKATVVRARTYLDGQPAGDIITHTYFVHPDMAEKYTLPLISIVTPAPGLFDEKTGIYVPGERYREGNIRTGNFYGRGMNWERAAHMEFFEPDGILAFSQNIGIRIHGGITRYWPQKSLRLYARSDYGQSAFEYQVFPDLEQSTFKRLLLRQSGNDMRRTLFRDAVSQSLLEDTLLDLQAYRPALVFINGEYWGIHNIRERQDKHYLGLKYGFDPERVTILDFESSIGDGSREGRQHYLDMIEYIRRNDISRMEHYRHVQTMMDTDNFIDYQVAQIYFANTDWPWNNISRWRYNTDNYQPDAPYGMDGRWRWLVYDTDYGLGLATEPDHNTLHWAAHRSGWANFLLNSLLENVEFRHQFINRFADMLNSNFLPETVLAAIDEKEAALLPEIHEHYRRWPYNNYNRWQRWVGVMRDFVKVRPFHVRSHIVNYFSLPGQAQLTVNISGRGTVLINTLEIAGEDIQWKGIYFQGVPLPVNVRAAEGYRFAGWKELYPDMGVATEVMLTGNRTLTALFVALPLGLAPAR